MRAWAAVPAAGCLIPQAVDPLETGVAPRVVVQDDVVISGDLECRLPDAAAVEALDSARLPAGPAPCRAPERVRVTEVHDGDTFSAWPLSGAGTEEVVRIIGVDTPETYGEPECWGPEASVFAAEVLDQRDLWLTFDGDCQDDFGRTLAYVHLSSDSACFFERLLLRGGFAETMTFSATSTFSETFADDQRWADDVEIGMWQACD